METRSETTRPPARSRWARITVEKAPKAFGEFGGARRGLVEKVPAAAARTGAGDTAGERVTHRRGRSHPHQWRSQPPAVAMVLPVTAANLARVMPARRSRSEEGEVDALGQQRRELVPRGCEQA